MAQTPRPGGAAIDRTDLDTTCSPCRDFYRFANGGWLDRHPIPPSLSVWGSLQETAARTDSVVSHLLEGAALDSAQPQDPTLRKLGDIYGACMDTARINADGVNPILPELGAISRVKDPVGLSQAIARLHLQGVDVLFRLDAEPDFKQSAWVIGTIGQGGMGLPLADQYTSTTADGRRLRDAYLEHIARMFRLLDSDSAEAWRNAGRALEIETALASASMTAEERRNPDAIYHMMKVDRLRSLAPGFPWGRYFSRLGLSRLRRVNVAQPLFARRVGRLVRTAPPESWRAYLRWRFIARIGPSLGGPFDAESFRFRRMLTGTASQAPRSQRCRWVAELAMGQALGRAYAATALSPAARAAAIDLVANLQGVLREHLRSLDWMSDATRGQALAKLNAFGRKVGYPEHPLDYARLTITRESHASNVLRASEFAKRHELAKIDRPLDRGDWWDKTPLLVDAFYSQFTNEMVLPAGILQPPLFDAGADDAINYGGLGSLVGHELTHAFDDKGRQFDAEGNLRDWWTATDRDRFKARARRLVEQFNGYTAVDTVRVNGTLTLGENIADLGGLRIAYEALQRRLPSTPREAVDGFTPEQRFFLAYARNWRANLRPETARVLARTDPHAPQRWRVNGALSNLPEFARAFGCKVGDPMVRPDSLQAAIW